MKKTLKSLLAGVLAVLLLVAAVPMNVFPVFTIEANAQEKSGIFGENLSWEFVEDGKLIINGSGDMKYAVSYPWLPFRYETSKIVIGEGVESIAKEVFQGFEAVEAIELPDSLLSIGESAFNGCISLEEVVLPDNVGTVGRDAFYMCESLKKVEIGPYVNSIGSHAFLSTPSLESISVDKENEDYSSENGVLFNKDKTELIVFPRAGAVTEYIVPDGVTSIAGSAFYYCSKLKKIELPDSLLKIGEASFAGCSGITSITLPDGLKSIGYCAFEECSKLQSIEIPASVITLGDSAFAYCSSLESITFYNPETEINMGDGSIPYSSTVYGYKNSTAQSYARRNNLNFVEMENPNKVTSGKCGKNLTWEYDGNGTVYIRGKGEMKLSSEEPNWRTDFREAITTVIIEDGVTSISDLAFYGCTNLENVTLPETLKSIGETAFENCRSLTKITIPESVTDIGVSTFAYCSNLKEITLHSGITKIGAWMFMDCTSLKNVVIPDGVTVIGGAVFDGCSSLESVTIPATVTTIYGDAFRGCTSLTDVYFLGCEQSWNAIKCNDSTMGKENMSGLTNQTIHFANENHTTYKATIVTKVTCTKDGFEKRTYTCGCTEPVTVLATGHKWGNWKVTKAATVKAEGTEERACTSCNAKETRSIAKIPSISETITVNEKIKTSSIAKDSVFALNGQTVAALKNAVSGNVQILDKNSKAVADKKNLATGMQIVLTDEKGNVLDKVTVIVPGDVDGDGEVKAADARSALRAAVNLEKLSDCEKTAADLEATSSVHSVNSADARHILRMSVGLEDANDWLKNLK